MPDMGMDVSAFCRPNKLFIFYKRAIRFINIAVLLHITSLLGILLSVYFGHLARAALIQAHLFCFFVYGALSVWGVSLIFFSQMDALSRFQNYKLVKDLLFENGFRKRIVNLFISSRCQREAVKVAASDLGMSHELNAYYKSLKYQWFHVIPDRIYSHPDVLFTSRYWKQTFFATPYTSKYFFW